MNRQLLVKTGFVTVAAGLVAAWTDSAFAHGTLSGQSQFSALVNDIFKGENSLPFLMLVFFFSFFLGAAHALTPGHGKTVVSAYMVGTGGTVKDAITLGVSVTVTHLSSVVGLGIFLALTSRYVIPPCISSAITALSGLIIVGIGCHLAYRGRKDRIHHGRPHDHGTARHHGHVSGKKNRLVNLIGMGISGGMVPCYDAMSVMLIAFSLNRFGMGIALIAVFSLGLASVIIFLGIAFSKSSALFNLVSDQSVLVQYMPMFSSGLIIILGGVVIIRSFI